MQFHPLVSIVIPVYNGSNFLKEAIESALAQTYMNLEIIVVNDGSNDEGKTEEIALSYGEKIRYFSKPNGGTSTALNLAIKNMNGEYFSWLSHDDLYSKNKISRQIQELAKLEDKNTIMLTDLNGIDENYKEIYRTDYLSHIKDYPPRESSKIHPIIYNQTHGCTLLIPKLCFDLVGLFDEEALVAQDFEFFYRAFLALPHKLIPEVLVTARDSSNRQGRRNKHLANVEYSALYIKMIENLTEEEMHKLAPSKLDFYLSREEFFREAGYTIALDYIQKKMKKNLQISSYDLIGNRFNGYDLHLDLRELGIDSKQLVLNKMSDDGSTFSYNFNEKDSSKVLLQQSLLLDSSVVHMHLIHNLIDLNYLPILSRIKPTVITLHDPFFLGGHCVHHFDCKKWQTHCEDCPYLDKDFKLEFDYSALNFQLKKQAIQSSQITAIVASKWMQNKVEKSPIWRGKKIAYIPFGVDHAVFNRADTAKIREKMNLPKDDVILMFRSDTWEVKGTSIIVEALSKADYKGKVSLISIGKKGLLNDLKGKYKIFEFDWITDTNLLVNLYQCCNILLMPSIQETFGLMAIEAMSCGKLVLAIEGETTALPEIINSPECGIAVRRDDFANELDRLIQSPDEVYSRGVKCFEYAQEHYSKEKYIERILALYDEVIESHVLDDEAKLLLNQLKKHSNDSFSLRAISTTALFSGTFRESRLRRAVIKIIRKTVRAAWKLLKAMGLSGTIKNSRIFAYLQRRGIIDKLRGQNR